MPPQKELAKVHHVFLSYSRKDNDFMEWVRDYLRSEGMLVWTDEGIEVGTPLWKDAIEDAIEGAGCLVVILSPEAKESEWVKRELEYARAQKVSIFPLLARGDEQTAIPFMLIGSQFIDIRTDAENSIQKLIRALWRYFNLEFVSQHRERIVNRSPVPESPTTSKSNSAWEGIINPKILSGEMKVSTVIWPLFKRLIGRK
jgi:hypothetical protein